MPSHLTSCDHNRARDGSRDLSGGDRDFAAMGTMGQADYGQVRDGMEGRKGEERRGEDTHTVRLGLGLGLGLERVPSAVHVSSSLSVFIIAPYLSFLRHIALIILFSSILFYFLLPHRVTDRSKR